MSDRTINFGESETEATYQIQDTDGAAGGGNFVIAKDTNANTVLLQYNPSTDAFEYAADVDLSGSNLTADDVTATTASVSTAPTASDDVARKTEVDAKADTPHSLGGADHDADTLANLNAKVSDATLDDSGDARTPTSHAIDHEDGGSDEISVAGLSGDLADPQDPKTHAATHESGAGDEISVAGLSGDLADPQDPKTHAATHESGGSDTIDSGSLDANSQFQLFTTTTDPAASVGELWYRSDLD